MAALKAGEPKATGATVRKGIFNVSIVAAEAGENSYLFPAGSLMAVNVFKAFGLKG